MTRLTKTTSLALFAGAIAAPASAQMWESAIGGPIVVDDVLDDTIWVQQSAAGIASGVLSTGWVRGDATTGADDIYVVFQDEFGAPIWDTLLFTNGSEQGNEIVDTFDGYALVSEADSPPGVAPLGIVVTKLAPFGAQLWSVRLTGTPFIGDTQGGADIYRVSTGELAVSGRAAMPLVPVFQAPVASLLSPAGAVLWSNFYLDPLIGTESYGSFADIHEFASSDGTTHYIVTGYMSDDFTGSPDSRDTLVARLDAAGSVVWSNLYRMPYGEEGLGVEITENREIVITGYEHLDGESAFMMRLDPAGGLIWYNRYFGYEAVDGSVREVGGSRLATVGVASDAVGLTEARLLQTGPGGAPFSNFAYGGDRDEAGDAIDLSDDGFVIGAHTDSFAFGLEDFYTLSTDIAGKTGCEQERQIGFEPVQPEIINLNLRAQQSPENFTWQWAQFNPEHPVEIVCDPNPCPSCAWDFAPPLGVGDFSDVVAFLGLFGAMDPCADLAPPFGSFDFSDVVAFLGSFAVGCP